MDLKALKPLHGWRAFLGEVGVVVLGVLLALGAQQLVDNLQMRSEVGAFTATIDHEIALNLFAYDVRTRSGECNKRRIADLQKWLVSSGAQASLPKIRTSGPLSLMAYRSAWDNRDADVFRHLPTRLRQKYAEFYDELQNNANLLKAEADAWGDISKYGIQGPLSLQERRDLNGSLWEANQVQLVWNPNIEVSKKIARELGITPIRPDNMPPELDIWLARCRPVFVPSSG